jgi:hypothetical protein
MTNTGPSRVFRFAEGPAIYPVSRTINEALHRSDSDWGPVPERGWPYGTLARWNRCASAAAINDTMIGCGDSGLLEV